MKRCLIAMTIALTVGMFDGVCSAQKYGGGGNSGAGGAQRSRTPAPPPAQTQLSKDQAAVNTAQMDYDKAARVLADLTKTLHSTFEQNSEWKNANDALNKARAELDAATKLVLGNLAKTNPDYRAAKDAQAKAEADLDAAKKSEDATPTTLTPLASAKAVTNAAVGKIEKKALDADPTIKAARDKVAAAQAAIDQLNTQFQATLSSNTDWQTDKQAADDAHQKLADAQAKVAADKNGGRSGSGGTPPGGDAGGASANPPGNAT